MKTYKCTLEYELEIKAKNQEEAQEEFQEQVNNIDLTDQIEIVEA